MVRGRRARLTPQPSTPHHELSTLNPQPSTLNPEPSTPNPRLSGRVETSGGSRGRGRRARRPPCRRAGAVLFRGLGYGLGPVPSHVVGLCAFIGLGLRPRRERNALYCIHFLRPISEEKERYERAADAELTGRLAVARELLYSGFGVRYVRMDVCQFYLLRYLAPVISHHVSVNLTRL